MTRASAVLVGSLVVTNLAWAVSAGTRRAATPEVAPPSAEVARLEARVRELEEERAARERAPLRGDGTALAAPAAGAGRTPAAAPSAPASAPAPSPAEAAAAARAEAERREVDERAREEDRRRRAADRAARAAVQPAPGTVDGWKADVLQLEDPGRREQGLRALEAAMGSRDASVAVGALRSLYALRDVAYDKARFAPAILARLDDEDAQVRRAAAYALVQAHSEPPEVGALLDALAAHPEDTDALITAAWLSKGRVEGRLADLYLRALGTEDARVARNVANQLRGLWVTEPVENAVIEVWRKAGGREGDGWWHILGQVRPTREARVRLIYEALERDDTSAPQLLGGALAPGNLDDPRLARLAADLSAEGLSGAPNVLVRRLHLQVLARSGTADQAPLVRAFAANEMVAPDLRKEAAAVAEQMERRP